LIKSWLPLLAERTPPLSGLRVVVEGAGVVAVGAKGIADVGKALGDLAVQAGKASDSMHYLEGVKKALVPGFGAAQASVDALAKTLSTLEYRFHALVPGAQTITDLLRCDRTRSRCGCCSHSLLWEVPLRPSCREI